MLVGKAVTIVLATLVLALHILWSRPFAQEHAWKGPVRAALLVLAAASAAVVAWAGALDLRIIGGARAVAALTAGAYFLVVLFSITIVTLVVGVATAMMKGARDESVRIHDAEAARALAEMHSECPSISEPASPSNDQVMCSIAVEATNLGSTHDASVVKVASAAAAATASAADDQVSFTTQSARRLGRRGGHGSSRRRQRPALFSGNPGLTAAAASLRAGATASDTDVRDACESILSSLASLSADEASRASSALLPGLSGWLKTIVSYDSVGEGTGVALVAVCRAMAALSDHADADTMAQLRKSELPRQLVALLQRGGRSSAQRDGTESFLSQALWVLGNATADKGLAAEFISAGGAGVLVALIDISDSSSAISDASFQVCVSIASISIHAAAAIALLDAGVLGPLARCFLRGIGGSNVARAETSPQSQPCLRNLRGESVVDAEAASRALANVLRWWGGAGGERGRPSAFALRVCSDLASHKVIAVCTTALRRHVEAVTSRDRELTASVAANAADVLLSALKCARLAEAGSLGPHALAEQAATAGTEEAVQALLLRVKGDGETADPLPLGPTLVAIAAELGRWQLPATRTATA